ncbi:GntR family transcriptional regulator [Leucobacter celer]|uniref:GntR family transcriptional regulator n=1 Tax=Leucobacter celer TaxID=668625 RepID=UPI0009F8885D|nr:GntR family transcriptional regulator [Leucobacter celer]
MLVRVNEASERPIYAQIADSVRADIAGGRVGPGAALPPAREVATGLGINVHTVLRAYQQLRDEGLIDLKRRRGAVVTQRATGVAALRDEVRRLVDRAAQLGVDAAALAALVESTAESGSAVDGRPGIGDGAAQVASPVPPVRPAAEHAA